MHQPVPALPVQYSIQPQHSLYGSNAPLPLRQPVPVSKLPKLVRDSEREFTDLKMALDHLLSDHTELSEHYKYSVLTEQLVLDEAQLIAQSCRHYAQSYTAANAGLTAAIWTATGLQLYLTLLTSNWRYQSIPELRAKCQPISRYVDVAGGTQRDGSDVDWPCRSSP